MRNLFVVFLLVFSFIFPTSVCASSADLTPSVIFAVYDATNEQYLLDPIPVSVSSSSSYLQVLKELEENRILDVTIENGSPSAISNTESGYILTENQSGQFYLKTDNTVLDDSVWLAAIGNSSIIEVVFSSEPLVTPKQASLAANSFTAQNELTVSALTDAGHWLSRNEEDTTLYFMAMTASNQSLSPSDVATLPYTLENQTPTDAKTAAEELLMLSACGYSQTTQAVSNRIEYLASCTIDSTNGDLIVQVLRALDSRNFSLPDDAKNTRFFLCSQLLALQNEDGGFSTNEGFSSSPWTTLDAMLVLSSYAQEDEMIANAIREAASYISQLNQTKGLTHATTYSSTRILAKMISALICNQIDPYDDRYSIDNISPIEYLLQRQNDDGGFCAEPGGLSSLEATETAVLALSALNKGKNPYIFSSQATQESESAVSESAADRSAETQHSGSVWIWIGVGAIVIVCMVLMVCLRVHRKRKKS